MSKSGPNRPQDTASARSGGAVSPDPQSGAGRVRLHRMKETTFARLCTAVLLLAGALCGIATPAAAQTDQSERVLVSNVSVGIGSLQSTLSLGYYLGTANIAQGFVTGPNESGYAITEIRIRKFFDRTTNSYLTDLYHADLRAANSDDEPGDVVATLTYQSGFTQPDQKDVIFDVQADTELMPGTRYFVVTYEIIGQGDAGDPYHDIINNNAENATTDGWSIDNALVARSNFGAMLWTSNSNNQSMRIEVRGSFNPSTDATLSALALADTSGNALALAETFAADTTAYTATVAKTVSRVRVLPTMNHGGAAVAYLDGTDAALTDADPATADTFEVDVEEGENVIKVAVTAEDGTTPETYTITVTRERGERLYLSVDSASIAENGGTTTVTVGTGGGPTFLTDQTATLVLTGTSTELADYTIGTKTLTLPAGDTAITTTLTGVDDGIDDDGETITITGIAAGAVFGTLQTVTITDDDAPPVLELSADSGAIDENGGTSTLTVSTGTGTTFARDQTVTLALSGTATLNADYSVGSVTLTLPAGVGSDASEVTTTVTGLDDSLDDDDEQIVIQGQWNGADFGTANTIVITDDDEALSVDDATAGEGAGTATFTVALSAATNRNVTVSWTSSAAAGDTATAGEDFTATTGTVTIALGDTVATFDVPISDDDFFEGDETFTVTLSGVTPPGAAVIETATATGTIVENDTAPVLILSVDETGIDEDGGTSTVTVSTGTGPAYGKDQTITLELGGLATEGADYTIGSKTLTLAAAATTVTTVLTALDDTVDDDAETVTISGKNGTASFGTTQSVTIADDDDAPELDFSVNNATIGENGQTATVRVSTGTGSTFSTDQTIALTLGGTATETADYTIGSTSLILPAETAQITTAVAVVEDLTDEENETITVAAAHGGNAIGATHTITITDNDSEPRVRIADANAAEGEAMSFAVTVEPASGRTVKVNWATSIAAGDTGEAADFAAVSETTLTFAPGEATKNVIVYSDEDTTDEDDETFTVTLTLPADANATLGDAKATGTIADDDDPPSVGIANQILAESADAEVAVTLSQVSEKRVTVQVAYSNAAGNTATASTDYDTSAQTIIFEPGADEAQIAHVVFHDVFDEDDETFTATLFSPQNASLDPAATTAILTVLDDDDPPSVGIAAAADDEGDGIEFTVSLDAVSGKAVTVNWATSVESDDTAAQADFTAASGELTLAAGDRTGTFTVLTVADDTDETNETFSATLSSPANATLDPDATSAKGTIRNNDRHPVATLTLSPSSIRESDDTGTPGNQHVSTVTATLDRASGEDTTITVSVAPVSPAEAGDITLSTDKVLTIPANQTASTGVVTLTAVDNDTAAPNKAFTISATAANTLGVDEPGDETLTVVDEDPAPRATLVLEQSSIRESNDTNRAGNQHETTVKVTLDRPSSQPTTVTLTASDAFTTNPANGRLTIPANALESTASVRLIAVDDDTDSPDRDVTVTATAVNSQSVAQPDSETLTIEDEDPAPTVTLVRSRNTIGENGASMTVKATLSHPSSEATTVTVSAAGTVARAAAFTLTGATLTIPAGQEESTGSATITATNNDTDAPDQVVAVSGTARNTQGIAGDPDDVEVTITDDEAAPTVTLQLPANPIQEDNGSTTVTATLDRPSGEDTTITVSFAPVSPAVAGDITLSSDKVLTIPAGRTASTGVVTLTAVDNDTDTPNKAFTISATAANTLGVDDPDDETLTVVDEDPAPKATLVLEQSSIRESDDTNRTGNQHETTVKVTLDRPSSQPTTVTLTASDAFTTNPANGRLTIPAGALESTASVRLIAVDDDTDSPDRDVTVTATAVNSRGVTQPESETLTIEDEEPAPTVTLVRSRNTIGENGGSMTVKATLSHPSSEATTVTVSATGTVARAAAFRLTGAVLTIPAGQEESTSSATITTMNNDTDTPDQVVAVSGTARNTQGIAGDPDDVEVTITDDEATPTVTLHLSVSSISEESGTTTVRATLSHPSSEATTVTVSADPVSPALASDFDLSGSTLTVPRDGTVSEGSVTVTAVPNFVNAPNKTVTISGDAANTQGVVGDPPNLTLTIENDDVLGFLWAPESLRLREGVRASVIGGAYGLALTSEPTADVTVTVTTQDTRRLQFNGEPYLGLPSSDYAPVATRTFTPLNWQTPQTFDLIMVPDDDSRSNTVVMRHAAAGGNYQGHTDDYSIAITDTDVKTRNIVLSVSRSTIAENGGDVDIEVAAALDGADLTSATSVAVTVGAGTAQASDFSAQPNSFTLTIPAGEGSVTRTVTLSPVNDDIDEADETIAISGTTTATVEDASTVLGVTSTTVTIKDDETRGVTVSHETLQVDEEGQATYTVVLDSRPTGPVTVTPALTGDADVTVSPPSLTFQPASWDSPQTVTVEAADDGDPLDDTARVGHSVSGADYGANSVSAAAVAVTVTDDDERAVEMSETRLRLDEGSSATYTVTLSTQPTGPVTVRPAVPNNRDVTVSPLSLSFTTADWDQPKSVTVTAAVDADGLDDTATVTHTVSGADYGSNHVTARDLPVAITDLVETESIALSVSPDSVPEGSSARTVRVTAALDGAPRDVATQVTVQVTGDTADATDFTAFPAAFVISIPPNRTQGTNTFRLSPIQDSIDEGIGETLVVSGSSTILAVTPATITIEDDDGVGFTLSRNSLTVTEDGSATYTMKLATQPTGPVTVRTTVTDNSDVTVDPPSLDFTVANWNDGLEVTVKAAEDPDGDDETATVTHTASGADYEGLSGAPVMVTVDDIDLASRAVALTVEPAEVSEDGGTVTVTAALDGAARAVPTDVTVTVTGGTAEANTDFATVADFTITIPPNVTEASESFDLSPVNDDIDEGEGETVTVGGTTAGLTVRPATLTITDDDMRGIVVTQGPVTLLEEGSTEYGVALSSQPTDEVSVQVQVSGNPDVTVDATTLTFTTADWSQPQPVTVMAAHDDDGTDDTAELRHTASGADYRGVTADPVPVTVTDNDERGVLLSRTDFSFREEGQATYTVQLATQPSGPVTVTPMVPADSDVRVSPLSLLFAPSNWNRPQTFTLRAGEDADQIDDNIRVTHTVTGADYGANNVAVDPVAATVTDIDKPSTTIILEISADTLREGAGATPIVVTATLDASSESVPTEVTLSLQAGTAQAGVDFEQAPPVTLTIAAGQVSATAQVVLTLLDDHIDEEQDERTVTIAAATTTSLTLTPSSFEVTIVDDDVRGLSVSPRSLRIDQDGMAEYMVVLKSEPTEPVTVTLSAEAPSQVEVTPMSLDFTASDWSAPKMVMLQVPPKLYRNGETATVAHKASGAAYNDVTGENVVVALSYNAVPEGMPRAWLARIGRTVADQVLDAVEARMTASRVPGTELSVAGQRIGGGGALGEGVDSREATDWLRGETGEDAAQGFNSRAVTERDFLLRGSSFALTGGSQEGGLASIWGRGAISFFEGRDADLTIDGEVASAMLGADWSLGRTTVAGLMLSHSQVDGSYRSPRGNGEIESDITGLYPYGRLALNERVSVWAVMGYGEGMLTLKPEGQEATTPDMDMMMAAAGLRGTIVDGGAEKLTLAVKTDAMVVSTSSDGMHDLAAAEAESNRLRLGLEGSLPLRSGAEAVLTPSFEIGLRHDGGDAETGMGADIGGGIAWSDPQHGTSIEIRGRGLLSLDDGDYRDYGFSASLTWDPRPASDRGLLLSLGQTVGASSAGGLEALLSSPTLEGLAVNDAQESLTRRRLEVKLGYGFAFFDERYTAIPEIGLAVSDVGHEYSVGWLLMPAQRDRMEFNLGLKAIRRESVNDNLDPENRIDLRLGMRW